MGVDSTVKKETINLFLKVFLEDPDKVVTENQIILQVRGKEN